MQYPWLHLTQEGLKLPSNMRGNGTRAALNKLNVNPADRLGAGYAKFDFATLAAASVVSDRLSPYASVEVPVPRVKLSATPTGETRVVGLGQIEDTVGKAQVTLGNAITTRNESYNRNNTRVAPSLEVSNAVNLIPFKAEVIQPQRIISPNVGGIEIVTADPLKVKWSKLNHRLEQKIVLKSDEGALPQSARDSGITRNAVPTGRAVVRNNQALPEGLLKYTPNALRVADLGNGIVAYQQPLEKSADLEGKQGVAAPVVVELPQSLGKSGKPGPGEVRVSLHSLLSMSENPYAKLTAIGVDRLSGKALDQARKTVIDAVRKHAPDELNNITNRWIDQPNGLDPKLLTQAISRVGDGALGLNKADKKSWDTTLIPSREVDRALYNAGWNNPENDFTQQLDYRKPGESYKPLDEKAAVELNGQWFYPAGATIAPRGLQIKIDPTRPQDGSAPSQITVARTESRTGADYQWVDEARTPKAITGVNGFAERVRQTQTNLLNNLPYRGTAESDQWLKDINANLRIHGKPALAASLPRPQGFDRDDPGLSKTELKNYVHANMKLYRDAIARLSQIPRDTRLAGNGWGTLSGHDVNTVGDALTDLKQRLARANQWTAVFTAPR